MRDRALHYDDVELYPQGERLVACFDDSLVMEAAARASARLDKPAHCLAESRPSMPMDQAPILDGGMVSPALAPGRRSRRLDASGRAFLRSWVVPRRLGLGADREGETVGRIVCCARLRVVTSPGVSYHDR